MYRLILILSLTLSSLSVAKENKSKLELGVGLGGQWLHDYRGSRETQMTVFPFPFAIYRGEVFKVDEEDGARGKFSASNRYELSLSADIAVRGSDEENTLRQGMPNLKTAVELGPELKINLSGENLKEGWMLRLPVRGAFLVASKPEHIGYTFNPKFTYKKPDFYKGWRLKFDIGALYSSGQYHDYYYSVDDEYVTDSRPEYQADSGFSGTYSKVGFFSRRGNWLYQFALRYDNLSAAAFRDSPLVETNSYYSFGFGVGWIFYQK